MKKLSFFVSLLVLSALFLAACGGADNNANSTPGAVTTPDDVLVPTEPAVPTEAAVPTELAVATEPAVVEPTATVAADAGAVTPEGETTLTAEANVPVTGDSECRVDNLENLLDFTIVNQNGDEVGEVGGLLISRSLVVMDDDALEATGEAGGDATPEAALEATATIPPAPGAENPPAAGAAQTGAQVSNAMVEYLVIDVDDAGTEALIPYQAFNFGETVPEQQDDVLDDDCVVTLNVSEEALGNLPDFDANNIDFTVDTWDEEFRTYWTDQGLTITETAEAGEGMVNQSAFIDDDWVDINARNTNGDDLGEVSTFITIPQTGEFQYAILAAGGFLGLGEKYIPVPMNVVQWAQDDDETDDLDDLGYLVIPIADDAWENAPSFDAVNEIDTTVEGWDAEIEAYWNSLNGNPAE